ncbi:MAG: hypothetical protein IKG21_12530 [Atopobiaceae bacterium]|nr:hypothetical protein [Atopobiaceae bacterium]
MKRAIGRVPRLMVSLWVALAMVLGLVPGQGLKEAMAYTVYTAQPGVVLLVQNKYDGDPDMIEFSLPAYIKNMHGPEEAEGYWDVFGGQYVISWVVESGNLENGGRYVIDLFSPRDHNQSSLWLSTEESLKAKPIGFKITGGDGKSPETAFTWEPVYATYPLWVNGVQVKGENEKDVLGDETVSFKPADIYNDTPATLTLDGLSAEDLHKEGGMGASIYWNSEEPLVIVLKSDASLERGMTGVANAYGVYAKGDLTFEGSGQLRTSISRSDGNYFDFGIYSERGAVSFEDGCGIDVEGEIAGIRAGNNITVGGDSLKSVGTSGTGIYSYGSITFEAGTVFASGLKTGIASFGDLIVNGGDVTALGVADAGVCPGGDLVVGEGIESFVSSGVGAIDSGKTVKNSVPGIGWKNESGMGDSTPIAKAPDGQNLDSFGFNRVKFGVKELTISGITVEGKEYDGTADATFDDSQMTLEGVEDGDDVSVKAGGKMVYADVEPGDGKNVGEGKKVVGTYELEGADAEKYGITQPTATADITKKKVVVAGVKATDKTYDGTTSATLDGSSAQLQGAIDGDNVTVDVAGGGTFASKDAGRDKDVTFAAALSGTDAGNYEIDGKKSQTTTKASINPLEVSVAWDEENSFAYDGQEHVREATVSNAITGDDVSLVVSGEQTDAGDGYEATVTGIDGQDKGNYTLPVAEQKSNFSITKVDSSLKSDPKGAKGLTYDGTEQDLLSEAGEATGGELQYALGDSQPQDNDWGTEAPKATKAGTYKVWYRVVGDKNHASVSPASLDVQIAKKAVTAAFVQDKLTYDAEAHTPELSATPVDVVTGDDCTVAYKQGFSQPSYTDAGTYTVGVENLELQGNDKENYEIKTGPSFTIEQAEVTAVGGTLETRVYDATKDLPDQFIVDPTLEGVFQADKANVDLALSGLLSSYEYDAKDAGDRTTTIKYSIVGTKANNYKLKGADGDGLASVETKGSISQKSVFVAGHEAKDKVYDGTDEATVVADHASVMGAEAGDDVKCGTVTGRFDNAGFGEDKKVTLEGFKLEGKDAGNYALDLVGSQTTTNASISRRPVTVKASDQEYAVGDTMVLDATQATLEAVAGQDESGPAKGHKLEVATLLAEPSSTDKATLDGKISVNADSVRILAGDEDVTENYDVRVGEGKLVVKKPAPKLEVAPVAGLVYNGAAQRLVSAKVIGEGTLEYSVDGGKSWSRTVPTGTKAGKYPVRVRVAVDEETFPADSKAVTATIAQREAKLAWKNTSFTYDGKAHQPTATVSNLASGDACAVTVTGAKTDAGSYTATATKLGNANYILPLARTCKFTIAKAKLTSIAKVADQAYSGKAISPKPAVKSGSKALKAGTDFAYSYKNNTKAGTATVTATGKGNYQGVLSTTFKIIAATTSGRAHVQGTGWQTVKTDPAFYGTIGKSLRVEALSLSLPKGFPVSGSIQYRSQIQGSGWEKTWKKDGATSGTTGQSKRVEAIQVKLTGDMAKKYDVYYRVHAQNYGWMGWAKNGAKAGTEGMSKRVEAVQVALVPKGAKAPAATYRGQSQGYSKAFVSK